MRAEGRWGVGRSSLTTQGQTGQKSSGRTHRPKKGSPCPVPRGLCGDFRAPGAGQAPAGAPRRAGVSGQGPEAPPTPLPVGKRCHRPQAAPAEPQGRSWGAGHPECETGPCKGHICGSAPRRPRVALTRCPRTSVDGVGRLAGSQKWSWVERVGVQEAPPGPGIPGHLAQGRKPSHPVCGKLQGTHAASSGLGPRGEAGRTLHSGLGLQRGG